MGATVRAYVDGAHEGTYAERELRVPREGATVDEETGVLIAPPLKMGPLMGGSGGLFLEHPRLGVAAAARVVRLAARRILTSSSIPRLATCLPLTVSDPVQLSSALLGGWHRSL